MQGLHRLIQFLLNGSILQNHFIVLRLHIRLFFFQRHHELLCVTRPRCQRVQPRKFKVGWWRGVYFSEVSFAFVCTWNKSVSSSWIFRSKLQNVENQRRNAPIRLPTLQVLFSQPQLSNTNSLLSMRNFLFQRGDSLMKHFSFTF